MGHVTTHHHGLLLVEIRLKISFAKSKTVTHLCWRQTLATSPIAQYFEKETTQLENNYDTTEHIETPFDLGHSER